MKHKKKVPVISYALKYSDKGEIEYNIQECHFRGQETHYTTVLICKKGIVLQAGMKRDCLGFKTVNVAKAHIKQLLLKIARNHEEIRKDIQALPIFDGTYQTHIKF